MPDIEFDEAGKYIPSWKRGQVAQKPHVEVADDQFTPEEPPHKRHVDKAQLRDDIDKNTHDIAQLRADYDSMEKTVRTMAELYDKAHPMPKPWYKTLGSWVAILCFIALAYILYYWIVSQGGIPRFFGD